MSRWTTQRLGFGLLSLATLMVVAPILLVIGIVVGRGLPAISWEFISTAPHHGMKEGGIFPAILGIGARRMAG